MSIISSVFILLLLLCCSAVFSASEISLFSLTKSDLFQFKNSKYKRKRLVYKLRNKQSLLMSSILISNNLVNILASAIATQFFITNVGDAGVVYATIVMTVMVVLFAEIIPKNYAVLNPHKFSIFVAPVLRILMIILYPIIRIIDSVVLLFWKAFSINNASSLMSKGKKGQIIAEESVRNEICMHYAQGDFMKYSKDMLDGILDLNKIDLSTIINHRKNLFSINIDLDNEDIIDLAIKSQYSRIPLWKDSSENIIGILHIRDLYKETFYNTKKINEIDISKVAKEPWFVPITKSLGKQLLDFRSARTHFAIVVDEYGGVEGIITLEDILEEIVGDINDEYDRKSPRIKKVEKKGVEPYYLVDGQYSVRDLNRELSIDLPEENVATVAGLIMDIAQSIPNRNSVYEFSNIRFTVIERRFNELIKIKIEKLRNDNIEEDEESDDNLLTN